MFKEIEGKNAYDEERNEGYKKDPTYTSRNKNTLDCINHRFGATKETISEWEKWSSRNEYKIESERKKLTEMQVIFFLF